MKRNFTRLVLAVVFGISLSQFAEAKNGILYKHMNVQRWNNIFAEPEILSSTPAQSNLQYYGGPVIGKVKVYAVFWGSQVDSSTQTNIGDFFTSITQSTYMDWLSEYNTTAKAVDGRDGTQQTIGRGTYAGSVQITPNNQNKTIDDKDIQAEIEAQIAKGTLARPDDNTLYMLYFPPGISITMDSAASCQQFCAYHNGFQSNTDGKVFYGVMPDQHSDGCELGCGGNDNPFDDVTEVSSHEFTEAVTDPFPTPANSPAFPDAWNTSDGNEIGDLCVGQATTLTAQNVTYTVQQEWDNARGGCASDQYSSK